MSPSSAAASLALLLSTLVYMWVSWHYYCPEFLSMMWVFSSTLWTGRTLYIKYVPIGLKIRDILSKIPKYPRILIIAKGFVVYDFSLIILIFSINSHWQISVGILVHILNNELCPRYAMATSHLRQIDSKHANSMFPEILKVN